MVSDLILPYYGYCHRLEALEYIVYCLHFVLHSPDGIKHIAGDIYITDK